MAPKKKSTPPVKMLSGGNPQIARGDGDAPVRAYIESMPGWKRGVGERLDALIMKAVPNVTKAVKWNTPFYGLEGKGFFVGFHVLTKYVKVSFFCGADLEPMPPVASKVKGTRYLHLHEDEALDEKQFAAWVKAASKLDGFLR